MTELEVVQILQELKGAGLANEPKDPEAVVKIWLDFFGGDDFRVIGKAVGMHLKKSHFWPAPADIENLKQRAQWLIEIEDRELKTMKLDALGGARTHTNLIKQSNHKTQPPRAPAIKIEEKRCELHSGSCVMMFSDMCDGPEEGKCPYEGL